MVSFKIFRLLKFFLISMLLIWISVEFVKAESLQQIDTTLPRSTIQRIRDRDNILIAGVMSDFPPFGFEDDEGEPIGFDVDLIRAMAEIWGVDVEFLKLTADARIPLLAAGEVDIIAAAMTHTQGREEAIDFSQTYFVDGQSLLVNTNSGITNLSDLHNKRVAAILGTTSIEHIKTYAIENETVQVIPFSDHLPALEALETGTIDALTTDKVALTRFAQKNINFQVIGEPFTYEPYGLGVQTNDSFFRNLVDATLQQLMLSGKYDELYVKWFTNSAASYPIQVSGTWQYTFIDSPNSLEPSARSRTEKVRRQQKIFAGVSIDHPPFGSLDEKGQCCIGFEIDLLREFAKRWLDDENKVVFVPITDANTLTQLQSGEVDIVAASLPYTWELEEFADFSQIYFLDKRFADELYAFALPANDSSFRDLVNLTLQEMVRDESYKHLYTKWFSTAAPYPDEIWPGMPTDPLILSMIQGNKNLRTTSVTPQPTLSAISSTQNLISTPTLALVMSTTNEISKSITLVPTQSPIMLELPLSNTVSAPTDYPPTGMSLHSYSVLPIVTLIIVMLFGGSIYYKRGLTRKSMQGMDK